MEYPRNPMIIDKLEVLNKVEKELYIELPSLRNVKILNDRSSVRSLEKDFTMQDNGPLQRVHQPKSSFKKTMATSHLPSIARSQTSLHKFQSTQNIKRKEIMEAFSNQPMEVSVTLSTTRSSILGSRSKKSVFQLVDKSQRMKEKKKRKNEGIISVVVDGTEHSIRKTSEAVAPLLKDLHENCLKDPSPRKSPRISPRGDRISLSPELIPIGIPRKNMLKTKSH